MADVIVVHKGDLPGADNVVAQVRSALDLSHAGLVPVLKVSARIDLGLEELWQAIESRPLRRRSDGDMLQGLVRLLQETIGTRLRAMTNDPELTRLVEGWRRGEITPAAVADAVIKLLAK